MPWSAASCKCCAELPYRNQVPITGNGGVVKRATDSSSKDKSSNLPLSGVRVLELGQLIAGPFAGQLLGCVAGFSSVVIFTRARRGLK